MLPVICVAAMFPLRLLAVMLPVIWADVIEVICADVIAPVIALAATEPICADVMVPVICVAAIEDI